MVEENVLQSTESIGNMLYCFSLLERKTSELYKELSERVNHKIIRPKLVTIAQDSLKHHNLFEEISKDLTPKNPIEKECKKRLEKTWNHIEDITKYVKRKKSLSEEEFFMIINRLAFLEHDLGEEYFTLENTKMLSFMNKEIAEKHGIDFSLKMDVLDSIIADEKQHINYLYEIHEALKEKNTKNDKHPEFKYQNPDAWWTPSHSQKTEHVI